jgi:nucleoid-associated protein YgaU
MWYREKLASLPSAAEKASGEYVVQPGDNLWLIAQKLLGDGNLFPKIASDNQISDPSLIRVGQKIVVKK